MQNLLAQHQQELAAERKWLFAVLAPNISSSFKPSDISVNKISANWKVYALANPEVQGLLEVEQIADKFVGWWAERKSEIQALKSCPSFQFNVRVYIADKVWQIKTEQGAVFDPDIRPIVHICQYVFKNVRGQIHEAVNRAIKVHQLQAGDDVSRVLDATLTNLIVELIRNSNAHLKGVLDEIPLPERLTLPSTIAESHEDAA